jgi:hypothetical protein
MALTEGLAALTSLKSLYEIAREVRDSTDVEKVRNAAAQMFDLALAAREQTALLQEERNAAVIELAALKAEIEKSNRFDDECKGYTRELNISGATVYREKESSGSQGKSPYYCPNCFAHKRISMLNPASSIDHAGELMYGCGVCKITVPLQKLWP